MNFPTYPAWASNEASRWDQEDSAAQVAFQSAYNRAADEKSDMNMLTFRKQMVEQQQKEQNALIASKLTPVANAFSGVQSPAQAWEIVSKNPQWMADPIQGEFVDKILKTQNDIAKAEISSLQGQMNTADTTDFMKRLATIDATDRAAIRAMSPNKDGSVSQMQWQALGLAEERSKVHAENERKMAEIDAMARGDEATTTISDKGVSTTYKPAPPAKKDTTSEEPVTKTLDNGTTLAWMPGSKAIHVITQKGDKYEMTPQYLLNYSKELDKDNPNKKIIMDLLGTEAVNQLSSRTNKTAPKSLDTPLNTDRKILKYNVQTGKVE